MPGGGTTEADDGTDNDEATDNPIAGVHLPRWDWRLSNEQRLSWSTA